MANLLKRQVKFTLLLLLFIVAIVIVIAMRLGGLTRQSVGETKAAAASLATNLQSLVLTNASQTQMVSGTPAGERPDFQLRPLSVVNESAMHQWTSEDARDTNIIKRLSHNDAEYQRMVEENARIHRRQLVYRKDTAAAVVQRVRLSGEPVTQLMLPGLDGQEFQFKIEQADLEASKQVGTFRGQITGKPGSLVTMAFKFGREAFTILSPDDGIYLHGFPREPGEIIIVSFDPDTYWSQVGGEPIKPSQK